MLWESGRRWGATVAEHARTFPADELVGSPRERLTRAVTVQAPADLTYRWLCQLSVAPYSYDLVDNFGRRSPRELTAGADDLAVGDDFMVFTIADLDPGRSITTTTPPARQRLLGRTASTYAVLPTGSARCRLLCRLAVHTSRPGGGPVLTAFAVGDLVMMRKQLRTLKSLAERDAARVARP